MLKKNTHNSIYIYMQQFDSSKDADDADDADDAEQMITDVKLAQSSAPSQAARVVSVMEHCTSAQDPKFCTLGHPTHPKISAEKYTNPQRKVYLISL